MKTAYLFRTSTSDEGTFGHLICEDLHLHTGELPWRDNERMVSCIPADSYLVAWEPEGKFKGYVITDVPNRDNIEIHIGNYCGDRSKGFKSDVLGCICLGLKRGRLPVRNFDQEVVLSSKPAIKKFHKFFNQESFALVIEDKLNLEEPHVRT